MKKFAAIVVITVIMPLVMAVIVKAVEWWGYGNYFVIMLHNYPTEVFGKNIHVPIIPIIAISMRIFLLALFLYVVTKIKNKIKLTLENPVQRFGFLLTVIFILPFTWASICSDGFWGYFFWDYFFCLDDIYGKVRVTSLVLLCTGIFLFSGLAEKFVKLMKNRQ